MRLSKVPTAIMASLLVVLPMLGIQSVKAFSQDYKRTVGDKISVERPLVVAKGDKVSLNVKFVEMLNANNYVWNWNVCGVKSTTVGTTWYTTKTYTMKSIQDCKVSIQAKATYTDPSKKPVNGSVEDTIKVLPSENIDIDFTSPVSAQVGQLFWLESAYNGPQGYNSIRWEWKGSGACKDTNGSYNSFTKIQKSANKKGICTMKLSLRVEYEDKVVKGVEVKNITIY